jgi:sulfate adenylyltransferase large subunit
MDRRVEILRFTTSGSVDDGKSTLVGRLLQDSRALLDEQIVALRRASERKGRDRLALSLLMDGLKAEQEQGITIDVGYRCFATPLRKFIIADAPGHIQYTRNMVTAASTANLAVLLVDARLGILEQTKRHALIASLLAIPHLVVCLNKMDLVDFRQEAFDQIRQDFEEFSTRLEVHDIVFIPTSALLGDNVVNRSENMGWYRGLSLLEHLESVHIASDSNLIDFRFPVQWVVKANDYRAYGGMIASGAVQCGDEVVALPSGFSSRIKSLRLGDRPLDQAFASMSINVELEDEIDVGRGDMLVKPRNTPRVVQDLDAMVCWLDREPLKVGGRYVLLQTTRQTRCLVRSVDYKIDINTLHRDHGESTVAMNDVARLQLRTMSPLMVDPYRRNRSTGSVILVDETTCATVGAGMLA